MYFNVVLVLCLNTLLWHPFHISIILLKNVFKYYGSFEYDPAGIADKVTLTSHNIIKHFLRPRQFIMPKPCSDFQRECLTTLGSSHIQLHSASFWPSNCWIVPYECELVHKAACFGLVGYCNYVVQLCGQISGVISSSLCIVIPMHHFWQHTRFFHSSQLTL